MSVPRASAVPLQPGWHPTMARNYQSLDKWLALAFEILLSLRLAVIASPRPVLFGFESKAPWSPPFRSSLSEQSPPTHFCCW